MWLLVASSPASLRYYFLPPIDGVFVVQERIADDDDDESQEALGGGPLDLTEENVERVLDQMRPYLISDGGNVKLVEIDGGVRASLASHLLSACIHSPLPLSPPPPPRSAVSLCKLSHRAVLDAALSHGSGCEAEAGGRVRHLPLLDDDDEDGSGAWPPGKDPRDH